MSEPRFARRFVSPRTRVLVRAALVSVVMSLLCAALVYAHDPGVGRVVVSFPSRSEYIVSVTVDAPSLVGRLEALAGQPRSQAVTGAECVARLMTLQPEFLEHLHVRLDGHDADAVLESVREVVASVRPDGYPVAPEVLLRVRGTIPSGARSLTWQYDLVYSSYALTLKAAADGSGDLTEWLEGGQQSQPFPLNRIGARPWRIPAALVSSTQMLARRIYDLLFVVIFAVAIVRCGRRHQPAFDVPTDLDGDPIAALNALPLPPCPRQ
jgi:hypothetical protein